MKKLRIYQIDSELDTQGLIFMPYDFFKSKGCAVPPASSYRLVFDGDVGTDNLGEITCMFNINHPTGYKGRSLTTSDIVELYDNNASEFHFCDSFGYQDVEFDKDSVSHDVHIIIAAEDGSSSGWKFDLKDATKVEIAEFIKTTVSDYIDVLLDELIQGKNSISILYGGEEVSDNARI